MCLNKEFVIKKTYGMKEMKNLPEGMIPDRDNVVYYDTEKGRFYLIKWEDAGNGERPIRHYLPHI